MKTSCIRHPANDYYVQISEWQLRLCDGDPCRAALLSIFEGWHNVKLALRDQAGQTGTACLWQWHTFAELEWKLLGLAKEDKIRQEVGKLACQGFVSKGRNPDPHSWGDNRTFYLFHPEAVQRALDRLIARGYHSHTAVKPRAAAHGRAPGGHARKTGGHTRKTGEQYSSSPSHTPSNTPEEPPPIAPPVGGKSPLLPHRAVSSRTRPPTHHSPPPPQSRRRALPLVSNPLLVRGPVISRPRPAPSWPISTP